MLSIFIFTNRIPFNFLQTLLNLFLIRKLFEAFIRKPQSFQPVFPIPFYTSTSPYFTKSKSIKEIDLLKMENEELLKAIGNQMLILAHIITEWVDEPEVKPVSASASNQKPKVEKQRKDEKNK